LIFFLFSIASDVLSFLSAKTNMDHLKALSLIGQTQKKIAKGIKVSPRTISRWLSGESKPKPCNISDFKFYIHHIILELQRVKNGG
jgi:hypothetical protein